MALNVEKLRAKAEKKPVGKPVGKEVAAQYYARQEAAKNKNTAAEGTAQASAPAAGTGTAVGAGTPSVPAASAPVDEVSSARAYLDGLAANLGAVKQSGTADGNGKPIRINGDLRGVAKQGLSGAFGKDLPSGAPAVRPGVQKSLDDYAAAVKAAETLDASGKLTEGDAGTLNKAFDMAVSDASAYDTIASRQAPVDFANKVDKLQSKPESGVRHDTYTAARPMEAIGGVDGAKMSFDEIRSANENFNKRYDAVYKDYTSGRATEADLTALGKEKAKLDKDNNAFLASAQDSFENAVKKAYVKYVPRAERMEAEKKPGIPSGYNGARADAAEADVQSLYMDVYAKFLRGEATEKELAELKVKAEAVKAQNDAFWETTDGIIEYGKRLQANRSTIKKELDAAEKWNAEHEDEYLTSIGNEIETANQAKADNPKGWDSDRNVRMAREGVNAQEATREKAKALKAAYKAANYAVNLNDLQYTYNVKYKQQYETALKMNNGSQTMRNAFGYTPKSISEIDSLLLKDYFDGSNGANEYESLYHNGSHEEKQIFAFLLEKKSKKEAEEFVSLIQPLLNLRASQKMAKKYRDAGFFGRMGIGFTTQVGGGLSDFGAGALGVGKALIGDTSYTFPTTAQSVASGVREAEKGTAAGIAMDMIRSTANMAPSIAIGAAMQAAGLPGAALVRSISFGGSAAGNAYIQSINEGKDYGESVLYGAVVGASEVCLERALGGIEGLGGKGVSRFMQTKAGKAVQARLSSFLSKFGTTVKRRTALEFFNATGRFLSNNTSEGIEEFTQDMLDPIFRNVIFGEDNAVFTQENFDNAMYSFCVGFWNAGLLNATSEISRFKKVNRILKGTGTIQDVTDALESPEMRRDLERIFTRTFADEQDGKFTFSNNELVNAVFLEMWQKGVKQGTAHADDIRAAAGDTAGAARSGAELAEAVNKAADSVADSVGEDIRTSQRVVDADVTADSDIRTEQAAADPVRENAEQARGRAVSTAGAAENAGATVETETPTASAVESTGDVGTVSAESTASDTSKIEQIKQKAISPKEALDNSSPYADESYSEIDKKSSRAAEALSGALGVNIKIFRDMTGIGSFYDSASDTLYIDGDGDLPVSYQLRRGLMTLLASSDSAGFAKLRDFLVGKYIEMFGKDAYTEYADKKKKVFAKDGLSLDDIGVGNELCADLGVFMLSDADTARAIAKELRTPEAKKLLRALEMLSKTEGVNFDFLPTAVDSLSEADMQAAEKMVLDMFFRDGVGKDRKNSYVVAEKAESKASDAAQKAKPQEKKATAKADSEAVKTEEASTAAVKTDAVPEVTGKTDGKAETEVESKAKTVTEPKAKTEVKAEIQAEENQEETPKVDTEAKVQANQEGKAEAKPEVEPKIKTEVETEIKTEEKPGEKIDYVFADLPEHTVEEGKHTKTGEPIYILKLKDRVSTEDYKAINTEVKAKGGYYSRYAKGFIVPKEIFDAYNAFAEGQKAVDNSGDVGYNEVGNVKDVKNGKEGTEDVQGRGILDGESGHDGGRLRREAAGSDDGSGDRQDVSEARKDGGRVLQGNSLDQASGRDGGNDGEGANGIDVRGSDHGEVKESSSGRGRRGDLGRTDSGHVRLVSEQPLTEESGADTEAASDVSSTGKKAVNTATPEEKEAVKPEDGEKAEAQEQEAGNTEAKEDDAEKAEKSSAKKVSEKKEKPEKKEPEKASENTPEEVDTEATAILKKRPSNKENFSISEDFAAKLDNTPPNAMDNIAAIKLLKQIEQEGRTATTEEKEILAKYKGWGGINLRNIDYEARRDIDNLFSYEQRISMQNSSLTAYFTPTKVIDAMYTGLMRMGFKGGNILESSMGIGNFFGRMPAAISSKSSLTGVEMESYTARIAQLLYPGATVINKPFQDVAMRNDAFDLVIGNVPFDSMKLSYGKKKYSLHNYFILSSLDKVREGGVVAVLTSAGTLDSYGIDARKAIMDKADVVACYKLPEGIFSRNANTDVQTDLLILRKRASGAKPTGDSILNVVTTKDGLRINEYFEKHPENVLGTLEKGKNAWGEITTVKGGTDFYDRLNDAMNKLPSGLFTGKASLAPVESIVSVSTKPRFFEQNGSIYEDSGQGKAIKVSEKKQDTVRDYMAVRDAYKEMLDAYGKNLPEEDIKPLRDKLTSVYDNFTEKHGPITGDGKKKIGSKKSANNTFLEADSDYYLVGGLEKYDEKAKKFEKSALFEKDTLRKKEIEHVDTASDALVVSLNESGKVDFKRMHELTGMSEQKLIDELSGEIILTPDGDYVLTDIYLSGNIYEKLDAVKGKKGFEKQQEMLERAIPKPKNASEIDVKLGANYIDAKYIEEFARDVFRTRLEIGKDSAGHWSIEGARASRYGDILTVKYGIPDMNAVQILEKILNDSEISVMSTVMEGGQKKNVFDEEMTNVAKQKADDIREAFADWVFKSTERRNEIVDKYNRMYNNYKPIDYGKIAEKLSFDSMDADLKRKLYPHQKRAIARALFGGDVLFAHGVGTGKTFEMIASVMEAKRMGLINKAAMVVPKNKVSDFKKDIAGAYPNAKVLVVGTQNIKRQSMIGLIGSNDWDIVLLSRETFTKIPVSEQLQQNFVLQQLEEVQRELSEAHADKRTSRRIINGLKKRSETLENKLKEIDKATKRDENSVDFEKLGIDCICVDEAHNYKSIVTPTRLNIKGLSKTGDSQRANDMLMKLDYMRTIGGKIIFGTGTPITNTVSEIYNMARMVCPSVLEEAGINSLDEWVNTFCKVESTTEIDIGNNIKNKSTQIIRKFINPNEMIGMFRQFADVVFTEDVVKNLPKAKYIQVEIEGTYVHKNVMETVGNALKNAKNSEKMKVSSQVMAMATAAAADPKMLAGADSAYNPFVDYSAEELEFENSKMNKMCDITFDEYQKSNDIKGTQIIFCDSGAGSGTVYSFNLHKDIKEKLIKRGIPEDEIVIVQSQSDEKLEELFRQVNDGEVRVLIGTSAKMAEGLNVQKRVVAIHHPTVTFTPADLEQGNARGVRQGNINDEVRIYNYVQGDTYDAYKWQAQARKGEMIKRALRGDAVSELEDVGDDIDPADAMAVASGNPLVKDKIDIDKEVVRLKNLQRNYLNEVYSYQDTVSKNPDLISQTERYIANMERDIDLRDKYGEKDSIVIDGKEYTKKAEANEALTNAVQKAPKDGAYKKIGTFDGFDIMFKGETGGLNYSILLKGANGYAVEYAGSGNNIARLAGALRRLDAALEKEKARLVTLRSDLELAKEEVKKPFEHQSELDDALQRQKDITYQYEHYGEKKTETTKKRAETESGDGDIEAYRADKRKTDNWKTERAEKFKDSKAKVKPIPEIIDKIREKFDVPVRTGNMRSRGTLGQYDARQVSIRSRFANDLPTLSHELGHYLDAEYGFSDKEEIRELIHALPDAFKEMYSESKLPGEAFAEYLREYLTNKDEATKKHPEFTELFERSLSDRDMQAVNELADDINAYLSATSEERLEASVLSKEQIAKRDKASKSEALDNLRKRAKDYFVDDISALEELGELVGIDNVKNGRKSPYALAFLARKAEYTGYHIITNELCDMEGNPIGKSLMERLYPVGNNMDNFNYYLVAKRAVEVLKRNPDLPLMPDPTLNDVGELQRIVDEYDRRYPEFEKVSEDVYDFLRQVQRLYGQASGVESAEQLDFLEEIYPHYVPLKRAVNRTSEKLTGGAKSGYANQNSTIKRFKGSTEEFVAPTDSIIDMVMRVVKVARRNAVGVSIANIANANKDLANIIERVEPDKTVQSFNLMKQKEELLDKALEGGMVDEEGNFKDLINAIFDDVQMKFIPYVNGGKNIVSFRVNGKTQYFQIGNKRLYNAIANINSQDIEPTLKVLNKIQGIMKYGIVGVNPAYIIGNFAKDIGTAWYSSDEMNLASFAASYVATAKDILLQDPEYKRFLAMGGGHNVRIEWKKYYIKKEMERLVRAGDKKGLQKLWNELSEPFRLAAELYADTHNPFHYLPGILGVAGKTVGKAPEKIGEASEFVESIPRAQEFIRKAKDDPVGAMYAADEITTNFQKHGSARWINSVFLFGNAGIQGLHKAFRHYTKGTKKELAMRWTKLILTGILLEALQAAFNRDDQEEYENLSTYTKNNNYVLSLGGGRFFKVPKPREFGVFSSAIGRSIEYIFGNDEAFYDFADYVFDTFSPPGIPSITDFDNSDGKAFEKVIHGVLSDIVFSGAFDIGFNIDYKGDEIVPSYMDNYKNESDKVYDTTSKVAIAIGKTLNMSPIKVDYLLSNGLGVFGKTAQYLFPSDSSRRDLTFGIKSRLFAQSQYSTDVYDLVYEKAEKAKKAYDTEEEKGYSVETLLEYEDTQMLKTLVSQYRRSIRYSNLTTEEKEQRLTGLQALIRAWDSTPTEADKRSIELFESTGNTDVFYKTFASNIKSTLTGKVKVPQYEDGKIVAVKTIDYTAELSPDVYLMFFNDACKVVDEAKLALLNAEELDDEVKAKKVAKNIRDGISKLKKRYLEDYGKPTENSGK